MKRLLLPLLAAFALPNAASAESLNGMDIRKLSCTGKESELDIRDGVMVKQKTRQVNWF
tara:strand:- start:188 stop:364 length:177 start_codon:yes stop_codon:yes gene_type:complete